MARKNTETNTETGNNKDNSFLLSSRSPFSMQEAYKTLRTNITFSLPGSGCKCIGIVSSNRGDGKSTIAANLAISFGQIKKRVLLIDCDLRLPTIAKKLNIPSQPGLSDFLVGGDQAECISILHLSGKNIEVIPSGAIPPDSTILLESQRMIDLIEKLKTEYDYIIFDMPPITVVSDALLMSKCIDGYLVVVRHKHSEYSKVDEALRYMKFADCKIIGLAYNGKGQTKKYYKYRKNYYKSNYYYYKK